VVTELETLNFSETNENVLQKLSTICIVCEPAFHLIVKPNSACNAFSLQ
jgi:hypothetical protein